MAASLFLREQIYGRSRVPPLSALLQRQLRPVSPLPFRRDALLVQPPDWFEARVARLEQLQQQQQRDMDAAILALEELEVAIE